jgi:hypothetical protein
MAHTRSRFTAEPELQWPLLSEAFGAAMLDGHFVVDTAGPPTLGMLDHYAYDPIAVAASTVHRHWPLILPDFQTASSRLKACVLGVSRDAVEAAKWKAAWTVNGTTAANAFAAVANSSSRLWTSKHTAIAFSADASQTVAMLLEKTAAKVAGDIRIMGACLYFEP